MAYKISEFKLFPTIHESEYGCVYDAILDAIISLALAPKPVLLLEIQIYGGWLPQSFYPVEVDPNVFWAIKLAASMGIIIIEAAGNGSVHLDNSINYPIGMPTVVLSRIRPDFMDSGAIMVGACTSTVPHRCCNFSNCGTRIDCWAWGENVYTTICYPSVLDPHQGMYGKAAVYDGKLFGGTSAASAIIAGAALQIQGIAHASVGRFDPSKMRSFLSNLGTDVFNDINSKVGIMPDLKKIVDIIIAGVNPIITLKNPTVDFLAIFPKQTIYNAAIFEVTTFDQEIHLRSTRPADPFFLAVLINNGVLGDYITVAPTFGKTVKAEIWYFWTAPDNVWEYSEPPQTVSIHCDETNEDFSITLTATLAIAPFLASALVLDRSGSMGEPCGDTGLTRIEALKSAVTAFTALESIEGIDLEGNVIPGNKLGIVSFSQDATIDKDLTYLDANDNGYNEIMASVNQFTITPLGKTAIGKGIQKAKEMLDSESDELYSKSIVVFTDGKENVPPLIEQKIGSINYKTYAVGLGTADQVSTAALTNLTKSVGGYCLLTGELSPNTEDFFRLQKYFIQILMDEKGMDATVDPSGTILPDQNIRIPFILNETDIESEIVLLTDENIVRLQIETPSGVIVDSSDNGIFFGNKPNMRFCRMKLPLITAEGSSQIGKWYACLKIESDNESGVIDGLVINHEKFPSIASKKKTRLGARYNLSVYTRSNLKAEFKLDQKSFLPGEIINLRVVLKEYGVPIARGAKALAEIIHPDNTFMNIALIEAENGIFEAEVPAKMSGVYHIHFNVSGKTLYGRPFTREKHLTFAVSNTISNQLLPSINADLWTQEHTRYWLLIALILVLSVLLLLILIAILY